ncbi:MAG TPA: hypothetical protein VGR06_40175 [Actinophytocola sp.]|jgi:hypothetical protein|uniref:hypothetical protein n=1 Tax=Actinophytocola sp. TaxID=1872138 RepID=UPI002E0B514B|nr:hypothetical protein [Actinophytocola sp.]
MMNLPERRPLPNDVRARIRAWVLSRLSAGPSGGLRVPVAIALGAAVLTAGLALVVARAVGCL